MKYTLYGDGIHDDTAAIQELIDNSREVVLPEPEKFYLISKPLELHSDFRLVLPRFAEIRLADASNCVMLKNVTVEDYGKRADFELFLFLDKYSPDAPCENIRVEGGIWNFNNKAQSPNPLSVGRYDIPYYSGFGMLFYNVRNLSLSSMSLKDPVNFAVTLDTVSYFRVEDITFDMNEGNLYQSNMDGIHLDGNCHHGHIEKLYGTCYDDIVALNAHEGSIGPISDITIKEIYTDKSYSAVRLLSGSERSPVRNVHISDVHGTFYHFCIAFMRCYDTGVRGVIENITIDNIYAAKSDRRLVKFPNAVKYKKYGVINVEPHLNIKNVSISNLHRTELVTAEPTLCFFENSTVSNITLSNITSENHTDEKSMPIAVFDAKVSNLRYDGLFEDGESVVIGCK